MTGTREALTAKGNVALWLFQQSKDSSLARYKAFLADALNPIIQTSEEYYARGAKFNMYDEFTALLEGRYDDMLSEIPTKLRKTIEDAFDLLNHPDRLKATLRF